MNFLSFLIQLLADGMSGRSRTVNLEYSGAARKRKEQIRL